MASLHDKRDYHQEAVLAALTAVQSFQPGEEAFPDYIKRSIHRALKALQRSSTKFAGRDVDKIKSARLSEIKIDPGMMVARDKHDHNLPGISVDSEWLAAWIREKLDLLPFEESLAVYLYYSGDMTQSEVGKVLGVSQRHALRMIKAGRTKLRNIFEARSKPASEVSVDSEGLSARK